VQLRKLLQSARGSARGNAARSVGNRAPAGEEVFEQEHKGPTRTVAADRMHLRGAQRERRRQCLVEARLANAHSRRGDRAAARICRQQLAEQHRRRAGRLLVVYGKPGVRIRPFLFGSHAHGAYPHPGVTRRERLLEPRRINFSGAYRDIDSRHTVYSAVQKQTRHARNLRL